MYAIIENGNKQYKVSVGDTVKVEKLSAEVGTTVTFPVLLLADENGIKAGKDAETINVTAEVVSQGKEKKIIVFKYKAKKNERKKQGHRQPFTAVKITAIGDVKAEKATAKKAAAKKAEAKAE
jgi:large subunit ribosomal protein L21